jgi:hypothetical protein
VQVNYNVRIPGEASRPASKIKENILGKDIDTVTAKVRQKLAANAGSLYAVTVAQHQADVDGDCHVATIETDEKCYRHIMWAKDTGMRTRPEYYKDFPSLSVNSTFADFQCALYRQVGAEDAGSGHDCPAPCDVCDVVGQELPSSNPNNTPAGQWWSTMIWIFAAVLTVGVGSAIAWYVCRREVKSPKKMKCGLVSNTRSLSMNSTAETDPLTQDVPQSQTHLMPRPISIQYVQAPRLQAPQPKLLQLSVQQSAQARVAVPMVATTAVPIQTTAHAAMPAHFAVQS